MNSEDIAGWMSPAEIAVLRETASDLPHAAFWVEIGVFAGRSAHAVGLALPDYSTLVLVDSFKAEYDFDYARMVGDTSCKPVDARRLCQEMIQDLNLKRPDLKVLLWPEESRDARNRMSQKADVVFVDADHSKAGVLADCEYWEPWAKVLMGHDHDPKNNPEVIEAVQERYGERVFVFPGTTIWRIYV